MSDPYPNAPRPGDGPPQGQGGYSPGGQGPNPGGQGGYGGPPGGQGGYSPGGQGPYGPPPGYGGPPQQPKNGLGITGLVLGILSIPLGLFTGFGGIVLGILAIIFAAIGISRASKGRATNKGVAIGGLVTGILGLIIGAVIVYFAVTVAIDCTNELGLDLTDAQLEQCVEDNIIG